MKWKKRVDQDGPWFKTLKFKIRIALCDGQLIITGFNGYQGLHLFLTIVLIAFLKLAVPSIKEECIFQNAKRLIFSSECAIGKLFQFFQLRTNQIRNTNKYAPLRLNSRAFDCVPDKFSGTRLVLGRFNEYKPLADNRYLKVMNKLTASYLFDYCF